MIRNKLGFRSRTQIAAWVVEQERGGTAAASNGAGALPGAAQHHRGGGIASGARLPSEVGVRATGRSAWTRRWRWVSLLAAVALAAGAGTTVLVRALLAPTTVPVIQSIAGTGAEAGSGNGALARSAALDHPVAVAVEPSGAVLFIDANRVQRVTEQGTIVTVAGTIESGYAGDGGPATSARLDAPQALAVRGDGSIFIADTANNRIRRVDPHGVITTVAGTGDPTFSGDGGPAVDAGLDAPAGVAVGFGGRLLIADSGNNRIREVSDTGIITTFAGTGDVGYLGDGGPATSAEFDRPQGIAVDAEDDVFIADTVNDRIRKVDSDGLITTVAGDGVRGFAGDGQEATQAAIDLATGPFNSAGQAIAVDSSLDLFIADALNNRIRRIDVHGVITTVAGDGEEGYSGDQGPATGARLDLPLGVAVAQDGAVYIADSGDNRIRRVSPS